MKETRIVRNASAWDRDKEIVLIDVDIEVDIDRIARALAAKAYRNKKRKTGLMGGLIEVRVRGTKATPMRAKETA